jgi:hypothetical protein
MISSIVILMLKRWESNISMRIKLNLIQILNTTHIYFLIYFFNIRWCLPSAGSYKMNVDASGPSDDGKWGLVVVIRDDQGFV